MGQFARSLVVGLGMAAATALIQTPAVSYADVCGGVGGRHVEVGGCTDIARDAAIGVAVADDDDAAAQAAAGQPPCYTPTGVPYYTPGDAPCG